MNINNNKADAKGTEKNITCKKQEDMEKKMNFFSSAWTKKLWLREQICRHFSLKYLVLKKPKSGFNYSFFLHVEEKSFVIVT